MGDRPNIIVGVDPSQAAGDALLWAVRERELRGGCLTALLAWSYLDQPHRQADEPFDPAYGERSARATLRQLIADAAPDAVGSIDCRVVCDLPASALLDASQDADLLVVGARGLGGFRGLLLGSVSRQCVQHSTIPVAVVRRDDAHAPGPIVVGLDCSSGSLGALAWALEEGRLRQAPVRVVHAWPPVMVDVDDSGEPVWQSHSMEQLARRVVAEALGAGHTQGVDIDVRIVEGSATRAILRASDDAAMIVVGARGRGGFTGLRLGSVSHHVLTHARGTVVVVPPTARER